VALWQRTDGPAGSCQSTRICFDGINVRIAVTLSTCSRRWLDWWDG